MGRVGVRFRVEWRSTRRHASAAICSPSIRTFLGTGFFERIHVGDRVGFLCAMAELRDGTQRRKVELLLRLPGGHGAAAVYRALRDRPRSRSRRRRNLPRLSHRQYRDSRTARGSCRGNQQQGGPRTGEEPVLAAVSHELRTPLNSIIGFSDMLLCEIDGKLANDRQREHIEIVRQAGNHLLAVVNSILDVSKIEAGSYATTRSRSSSTKRSISAVR